jgi:hypothetical protein
MARRKPDHNTQRRQRVQPLVDANPLPDGEPAQATAKPAAPEPTEVVSRSERFAAQLRETAVPLFLNASLGPALPQIDSRGYQIFRDRILADCGAPTDPIEVMVIEQLILAHLNTGLLHCRASNSRSIENAAVYLSAAARLMAEFRRSALGLQAYRAAARQLSHAIPADRVVTDDAAARTEDQSGKGHIANELGLTPKEDDEETAIVPLRRSASL